VKQKLPEAIAVFIVPPSRQDLERRLRSRGQDSDEAIARRLERARQEIARSAEYDFVIVNDDLQRASDELRAIVVASRCRRRDSDERLRNILDSFGGS
jgi:guanylate kinase